VIPAGTTAGTTRVAGLLLAAGASQRFGADKQSLLIRGVPLLTRAACMLLDAGFVMPIVVLGRRAAEHRPLLHGLPVRVVENPSADTGMASSLVVGLNAAQATAGRDGAEDCDAVCVTLCDQPAATARHLRMLVGAWRKTGNSIVASSYSGTVGVPALFAATHFPELRQLSGDRGAGPLLARHAASVYAIPLPGGDIDIDTPTDLDRLKPLA
jgi:molybdenum cofactor cytidylyltransferase